MRLTVVCECYTTTLLHDNDSVTSMAFNGCMYFCCLRLGKTCENLSGSRIFTKRSHYIQIGCAELSLFANVVNHRMIDFTRGGNMWRLAAIAR